MVGAEVGDVKALDANGQFAHPERVAQRAQGLDAAGPAVLAAQAVLIHRQPRVALGQLAQPAHVAAPGDPHLDLRSAPLAQRLGQQAGALLHVGADDDRPRHRRRGGVVLADELLADVGQAALALVVEVKALALGEDPVADLEDLRVGVGALDRDADQVRGADRAAGDLLALEQRADGPQPVAVEGGPFVVMGLCGGGHLGLLVALDLAVAARQEVDDRVDVATVLLAVDVADAGRPAALDVVVEAGVAGAPARLGPLARPVLEQLAQQVERLPHPLGARKRPEVGAVGSVTLAGEVDAGVVLVEADADVGIGLVVAQADVEARPVALDEVLLREQGLGLVCSDEELDALDAAGEALVASGEVRGDPLADRPCLPDVEDLAVLGVEQVDAGRVGQPLPLVGDSLVTAEL